MAPHGGVHISPYYESTWEQGYGGVKFTHMGSMYEFSLDPTNGVLLQYKGTNSITLTAGSTTPSTISLNTNNGISLASSKGKITLTSLDGISISTYSESAWDLVNQVKFTYAGSAIMNITMDGVLVSKNPTQLMGVATKQYVDGHFSPLKIKWNQIKLEAITNNSTISGWTSYYDIIRFYEWNTNPTVYFTGIRVNGNISSTISTYSCFGVGLDGKSKFVSVQIVNNTGKVTYTSASAFNGMVSLDGLSLWG